MGLWHWRENMGRGDGTLISSLPDLSPLCHSYQACSVKSLDALRHLSLPQSSCVSLGKFFKVTFYKHLAGWFSKCSAYPIYLRYLRPCFLKCSITLPPTTFKICQGQARSLSAKWNASTGSNRLWIALPLVQSRGDGIPCFFFSSSVWTAGHLGQGACICTVPSTGRLQAHLSSAPSCR